MGWRAGTSGPHCVAGTCSAGWLPPSFSAVVAARRQRRVPRARASAWASAAPQPQPQPLWDAVLTEQPDFFVFAGDNVYASEQPFDVAKLHAAYMELAA